MQTLNVKHELIRWALERSGRSVEGLARQFPKLGKWKSGEAQPTLKQLEALAKKTWTPLGYFFLPEPPQEKLPIPDFRTVSDRPVGSASPNLIDSLHTMQRRQTWMRDYLVDCGHAPLSFIASANLREAPAAVAQRIRQVIGTVDGWASHHGTWSDALRHLREAIEEAGILVVINGVVGNDTHRKLDTEEFRGFVLMDSYAPLIFVNGSDAKSAQMFTLAHELAHLWVGESALFNLSNLEPSEFAVEQFCNKVAAEFLVPAREFEAYWPQAIQDAEPFQTIARHFKVSPIVAARRAQDLGLIQQAEFLTFFRSYQEDERRKAARVSGGGNFYQTQNVRLGKRFARAVALAAKEGRLLYRDAYRLTDLHGATFDKYAKTLEAN
ncbi:MAG: ImmA/IrrE family metallo-endopeptidase [Gallionella sp.]|nr:ImmA/IrrE family metallo-endopeptidase [Gallionella sp.]